MDHYRCESSARVIVGFWGGPDPPTGGIAELAALDVDARARWLELAEAERLSVRCLREELRRVRRLEAHEPEEEAAPQIQCPECGCKFAKGRNAPAAGVESVDPPEPAAPPEPVAA